MDNFYDQLGSSSRFRHFRIGDILFAEYNCPLSSRFFEIWSDRDYIVHVMSGRKTWHMSDGSHCLDEGSSVFIKKGASIIEQHFDSDFCVLVFFIPDDVVRSTLTNLAADLEPASPPTTASPSAIPITPDAGTSAFFSSMHHYFTADEEPARPLLELKLRELIVCLMAGKRNPSIASYFASIARSSGPSLPAVMEANFRYRLSLGEFARLCHCSLSKFKRDFSQHYRQPPGKWLLEKRLDHAAALLRATPTASITDVAFDSGFEDMSHFSKAFKSRFGTTPSAYRPAN